jgi:hypothetical protein
MTPCGHGFAGKKYTQRFGSSTCKIKLLLIFERNKIKLFITLFLVIVFVIFLLIKSIAIGLIPAIQITLLASSNKR